MHPIFSETFLLTNLKLLTSILAWRKISYRSDKWYTNFVLTGEVGSEIFSLLFRGTLKKKKKEKEIMKQADIAIFGNKYIAETVPTISSGI